MSEGAGVESATVVFYLIAAAIAAVLRPQSINRRVAIMLTIVLLAFGTRGAVLSMEKVVEMCLPVLAALGWVQACFPRGAPSPEERLADASD